MKILRRLSRSRHFARVAGSIVAGLLWLLGSTWRLRVEGTSPFTSGDPFVAALWHRNLLMAAYLFRSRRVTVPVSRSRDGDLTTQALTRLGFGEPPRGSSSRGGGAILRGMIRWLRQGGIVGVLVDGPRGPARRAKPGALGLARATGLPLYPIALSARRCVRFESWDRAILPLPFATVVVTYGEPLHVPKRTRADDLEILRQELDAVLDRLTDDLDARLGRRREPPGKGR